MLQHMPTPHPTDKTEQYEEFANLEQWRSVLHALFSLSDRLTTVLDGGHIPVGVREVSTEIEIEIRECWINRFQDRPTSVALPTDECIEK